MVKPEINSVEPLNFSVHHFFSVKLSLKYSFLEKIHNVFCLFLATLGIGPKKALSLIQDYKNIETILTKIDQEKYPPPPEWPYKEARRYKNS